MPKNIVLCSDGTGNSGGELRGTNVWRVFRAVDLNGHKWERGVWQQIAFHDDGVGTQDNIAVKALSAAFGFGLKRNITQLYTFLANNYEPGDQIFLFGFSRGAYTVRALAGLIASCGVVDGRRYDDKELRGLVKKAIRILRSRFRSWPMKKILALPWVARRLKGSAERAHRFRRFHAVQDERHAPGGRVQIRFVGAWDTVDAYGFPFDHLGDFVHHCIYPFRFPDRNLSKQVLKASHAISIDDERHTFHPVLWNEQDEDGTRINQVWFPGAHSNVGGGYAKDGMAFVTLDWMMAEAERDLGHDKPGLRFLSVQRQIAADAANAHDRLYNSRAGLAAYYRYKPRDVGAIAREHGIEKPSIHLSTFHRIRARSEGYAPGNLPANLQIVATNGEINAKGEAPEDLARLMRLIPAQKPRDPSLLDEVSPYVRLRRYCHYMLVGLTATLLIGAGIMDKHFAGTQSESNLLNKAAGVAGTVVPYAGAHLFNYLVKPFVAYPSILVALLTALLVAWSMGKLARGRMQEYFAGFWRRTVVLGRAAVDSSQLRVYRRAVTDAITQPFRSGSA